MLSRQRLRYVCFISEFRSLLMVRPKTFAMLSYSMCLFLIEVGERDTEDALITRAYLCRAKNNLSHVIC